jgi:DNA-binding transcriptional LysR family regulator
MCPQWHPSAILLLPGWLADFRRERPDVHPQLEIVNSQDAIDAIRENRSEIGFIEGPATRSSSLSPSIRGLAGVPSPCAISSRSRI